MTAMDIPHLPAASYALIPFYWSVVTQLISNKQRTAESHGKSSMELALILAPEAASCRAASSVIRRPT